MNPQAGMSVIHYWRKKKDQKKETLHVLNDPLQLSDSLNPPTSLQTSPIHTHHFVEGWFPVLHHDFSPSR